MRRFDSNSDNSHGIVTVLTRASHQILVQNNDEVYNIYNPRPSLTKFSILCLCPLINLYVCITLLTLVPVRNLEWNCFVG